MISGSTALHYYGINLGKINDLDVIVYKESQVKNYVNPDYILVPKEIYDILYNTSGYIYPEMILTIKMSHLAWDIKWEKTLRHINSLVNMGYNYNPNLYKLLKAHWGTVHGNKDFLSLSKNKDDFFNDHVTYVYDHDYLHELVAYPNKPVYTKCLKENEDVLIDKTKFFNMEFSEQVRMFREEITVIAIERWLVNPYNKGKVSWFKSWNLSLKKTITSLTKNWAADFIIHNIKEFRVPDYNYFKHAMKILEIEMSKPLEIIDEMLEKMLEKAGIDEQVDSYRDEFIYLMAENCAEDFAWVIGSSETWNDVKLIISNILEEFQYEHLDTEGGGEGGAEYCHGVFKLNDKIFMAEYGYYSHYGHKYDGIKDTLREVHPVEKTITVYE